MARRFTIEEIRARTYKTRDAWWTVLLVDPLAARLVQLVSPYRWITPNRLTGLAFLIGLGAAACFVRADHPWLVAGALLFHLSFVVDCMDGKIARLNDNGSVFGMWLDFTLDQVRIIICVVALMGGQYAATGNLTYLAVGAAVLVLDLYRYVNSAQIIKVRATMRTVLTERLAERGAAATLVQESLVELPPGEVAADEPGTPVVDVHSDFRTRFPLFVRVRNALIRRRIRSHLMSGVEFQMAVLVVAPLTGAVITVSVLAGGLMLIFELLLTYKMYTATVAYERELRRLSSEPVPRRSAPAAAG